MASLQAVSEACPPILGVFPNTAVSEACPPILGVVFKMCVDDGCLLSEYSGVGGLLSDSW